jgi:amino acid adenylation domain-containing protein
LKRFDRNLLQHIPLTFSQERLWFIDRFEGSVQYHLPTVLNLQGNLSLEGISKALQTVVSRHESLRSVIYEADGGVYQRVMDASKWKLATTDGSNYREDRLGLRDHVRQLISKPFDLTLDYMLRATLIKLDEAEHVLVVTMHHIASDGWSLPIIVKEVVELYDSYVSDRTPSLPELSIQYADYAVWQRNYLQGTVLENKMSYWKEKLGGVSTLQLPTDYTRPAIQSTRGNTVGFVIGKEDTAAIQQFCNREGATLFMTLLSVFKLLLHRYSGQQDICVGIPIAGRQQEEVEGLVGFFVNTLALRTPVNSEESFTNLLSAVKETTMGAYEHQEAPFEKIVEQVIKERDPGRSPLFQTMFVLQNTPEVPALVLPGLTLKTELFENNTSKYDISFYVTETTNGLHCAVEYCTDLYCVETIHRMTAHYRNLLNAVLESPGQKIGLLPVMDEAEQQQLLGLLNGKTAAYPLEKSLLDLFEEQSAKTPAAIALIESGEEVTYAALDDRSNQLSHFLVSKGVKPGSFVPVFMERSIGLVTGILAILKAGATYVPVDTSYPAERIVYMLEDTGASMVVTNRNLAGSLSFVSTTLVYVDDELISKESSSKPGISTVHGTPACIIYTSGSSGRPKGVNLGHAGIVNRLYWMWDTYPFEANERNALKTSIGFVDHIWELFGPLNKGIPSVIFSNDTILDVDKMLFQLSAEKITRLVLVPSLLRILLNKLSDPDSSLTHLKYWTSSGEKLGAELVTHFYRLFPADKNKLLNIYGSSEVTADISCYDTSIDYKPGESGKQLQQVPIGQAIANTSLYLMNEHQQLVPRGIVGEICVGGVQVGQGYLNLPELTREKFIPDPFSTQPDLLMFRTGDLGQLLPDGNIVCLGRIDNQVKIRGNRVELGEIETVLLQNKSVNQCVVVAQDDVDGNKMLVAYVVLKEMFNRDVLIEYLRSKLPEYMVPLTWVELDKLPLTPNGKIDKKALPVPGEGAKFKKEYLAPSTPLQEQLVMIWQQLLKKDRIGILDNFFELGGHSLLAMRVVSAIRSELKLELSIKELFSHPTIEKLSGLLQKQTAGLQQAIELLPRPEQIPLSFSQERLWFIDRLEGSIQYHIPSVLRLKGKLNLLNLSQALKTIIERHEVLRTLILEEDGIAYQHIRSHTDWQLTITNLTAFDDITLQTTIRQVITTPFDLAVDYMLRANLLVINEQEHILVATIHHIATDGWSMSVLVKELVELYGAYEQGRPPVLNPLPIQYADFAIWQRNYLKGDLLGNKIGYWQKKLDGVEPLQLAVDYPRPVIKTNAGARFGFLIEKPLANQLQQLSLQQDTTLFMTLLAAFKALLHRQTGQEDICVGIPIANRTMHEVEGLIGFFVNTLALRNEVNDAMPFVDLLQQVRATTMEAYEHQDTPFEKVVDLVVKERDLGRSPVFQVMFVWQNTPDIPALVLGDLILSREGIETKVSKFDITLTITETAKGLYASFDYCTDLFKEQSVEKLVSHFITLLKSIVVSPSRSVGSLPILSVEEEYQMLAEFNNSSVTYPKEKTIIALFEEQVEKRPDAIALVFEQEQLNLPCIE